jgi:hypothetical protein
MRGILIILAGPRSEVILKIRAPWILLANSYLTVQPHNTLNQVMTPVPEQATGGLFAIGLLLGGYIYINRRLRR